MLKWLFRRYHAQFEEFFVQELIGPIPKEINDDALNFLANGREKLELWLRWQAYLVQRKSVAHPEKADVYQGVLIQIKILMIILDRLKPPAAKKEVVKEKKKEDLFAGIRRFKEKAKKYVSR